MTIFVSTQTIQLSEHRSKWERIWPKEVKLRKNSSNQESFVRSRIQRYSINDSINLSKQTGYVNTVDTSKITVGKEQEQTYLWVLHNALPVVRKMDTVEKNGIFTSTIYFDKLQ